MAELSHKDQERFLISVVIAVVLHVGLFTGLHFFLNIKIEPPPEYTGPLYLEIGTEFEKEVDVQEIIPEEEEKEEESAAGVKQEKQTKDDSSAAIVKREDREDIHRDTEQTEPDINTAKDDEEYPDNEDAEEKIADTSTGKEEADKTPQPTPGATPTPYDPALEEDSLAQLDKILEGNSSGTTDSHGDTEEDATKTEKDDSTAEEGGGPLIEWEDDRDRNPIAMYDPVIPDWVSRQGLRLRVKVSFVLTPDGFLTSLKVEESSVYPEIDSRIMDALRKWRFPSVPGTKNVKGMITYVIGLK